MEYRHFFRWIVYFGVPSVDPPSKRIFSAEKIMPVSHVLKCFRITIYNYLNTVCLHAKSGVITPALAALSHLELDKPVGGGRPCAVAQWIFPIYDTLVGRFKICWFLNGSIWFYPHCHGKTSLDP